MENSSSVRLISLKYCFPVEWMSYWDRMASTGRGVGFLIPKANGDLKLAIWDPKWRWQIRFAVTPPPIQSTITFPQTSFNQRQRQGVPTSLCLLIEPTVRVPEKCRWHEGVTDICVGQGCQEESQGWKGTADQKRTVYFCLHTHTEGKNEADKMCRKPHNPPPPKRWA